MLELEAVRVSRCALHQRTKGARAGSTSPEPSTTPLPGEYAVALPGGPVGSCFPGRRAELAGIPTGGGEAAGDTQTTNTGYSATHVLREASAAPVRLHAAPARGTGDQIHGVR